MSGFIRECNSILARALPQSVKDIGVTFGANVLSRVFTATALVLVLKSLRVEEYGVVTLAQSLMIVGSGLLPQGINWAMIRVVSVYSRLETFNENASPIPAAFALEFVAVILTVAVFLTFPGAISSMFHTSTLDEATIRFVGFGVFSMAMAGFWTSVLQGHQRFFLSAALTVVQAGIVVVVYLALIAADSLTLTNVLWVIVLAPLAVGSIAMVLSFKGMGSVVFRWGELLAMLRDSRWFLAYTVILVIVGQLDVFMVARYCELRDLGNYGVANRVYHVLMLSLSAIHTVLLPRLSANPSIPRLREVMHRSFRYTIPIAVIVTVPLMFFAKEAVLFLSSSDYSQAIFPMRILLVGAALSLMLSPMANILFALRMELRVVQFSFLLLALQYAGHTVLTSRFGPVGAALTTVISFAVFNGLILIVAKSRLKTGAN